MQTHNKIRIIKRAERDSRHDQTLAAEKPKDDGQKQAAVRDVVTTINGWIGELRQKKDRDVAASRVLLSSISRA